MKTILLSLCLAAFIAPPAYALAPPDQQHHVMWTTMKGKSKCCNKKTKEKADRCAEKMRAKGKATAVQVMAGKCKDM